MQKQFSLTEVKNKLPLIIRSVEKGPSVKLTRRGRPVAVLLSIHEYDQLCGRKRNFWNALKAFRQVIEKEDIEISDSDFQELRDSSSGREFEWF